MNSNFRIQGQTQTSQPHQSPIRFDAQSAESQPGMMSLTFEQLMALQPEQAAHYGNGIVSPAVEVTGMIKWLKIQKGKEVIVSLDSGEVWDTKKLVAKVPFMPGHTICRVLLNPVINIEVRDISVNHHEFVISAMITLYVQNPTRAASEPQPVMMLKETIKSVITRHITNNLSNNLFGNNEKIQSDLRHTLSTQRIISDLFEIMSIVVNIQDMHRENELKGIQILDTARVSASARKIEGIVREEEKANDHRRTMEVEQTRSDTSLASVGLTAAATAAAAGANMAELGAMVQQVMPSRFRLETPASPNLTLPPVSNPSSKTFAIETLSRQTTVNTPSERTFQINPTQGAALNQVEIERRGIERIKQRLNIRDGYILSETGLKLTFGAFDVIAEFPNDYPRQAPLIEIDNLSVQYPAQIDWNPSQHSCVADILEQVIAQARR